MSWGSPCARTAWAARVLALGLVAVAGGPASAQERPEVPFEVTVVYVSPEAGGVQDDPQARQIDRLLGAKLRYERLEVLESVRRRVGLNEIESLNLPTGKRFRFRPLDVGPHGVLVAVDLETTAQGDFRIPPGKPLILGGQPYRDGQLVVVLEVGD